jgi:hypothetical protein
VVIRTEKARFSERLGAAFSSRSEARALQVIREAASISVQHLLESLRDWGRE